MDDYLNCRIELYLRGCEIQCENHSHDVYDVTSQSNDANHVHFVDSEIQPSQQLQCYVSTQKNALSGCETNEASYSGETSSAMHSHSNGSTGNQYLYTNISQGCGWRWNPPPNLYTLGVPHTKAALSCPFETDPPDQCGMDCDLDYKLVEGSGVCQNPEDAYHVRVPNENSVSIQNTTPYGQSVGTMSSGLGGGSSHSHDSVTVADDTHGHKMEEVKHTHDMEGKCEHDHQSTCNVGNIPEHDHNVEVGENLSDHAHKFAPFNTENEVVVCHLVCNGKRMRSWNK